jgi:valyl-tRNA synthetase
MSSTQDVRFSVGTIEEGRKLANKLWNASRLILNVSEGVTPAFRPNELVENWIEARLDFEQELIENRLGEYDFAAVADALYHLTFDDYCDWYLEAIKPRLYAEDDDARSTALATLERLLKLLHPVMPHVSEEIWSQFHSNRLIVAEWPRFKRRADDPILAALDRAQDAARIFRRSGVLISLEPEEQRIFEAVVRPDRVRANGDAKVEIKRVKDEIRRAEGKLANERFVAQAPEEVVKAEQQKLERYRRELDALGG